MARYIQNQNTFLNTFMYPTLVKATITSCLFTQNSHSESVTKITLSAEHISSSNCSQTLHYLRNNSQPTVAPGPRDDGRQAPFPSALHLRSLAHLALLLALLQARIQTALYLNAPLALLWSSSLGIGSSSLPISSRPLFKSDVPAVPSLNTLLSCNLNPIRTIFQMPIL